MDNSGEFASLDAKLAAGIARVAQGDLGRAISTEKEKLAEKGIFMKGRRALRMIHDHYRISETEGALLELQDLLKVSVKGDNLRSFLMDWEHVLTGMNPVPDVAVLETLFRLQVAKSTAMRDTMTYYNRLDMNHPDRNYDFLVSSVRRHLEQQRRSQTRQE